MGNTEVNYSDILSQGQPPKQLSLSCNLRVKLDAWKVIQAALAHVTKIFEMVKHPVNNMLVASESKFRKRHFGHNFKLT